MAREATLVLIMTSEIGHMMADASYCPSSATQADIMKFFESLILEHESSYKFKNSDINAMKSDISSYFDKVTADKNSLIAEEGSEAAANLVAGGATIAAAIGSWIPLVGFGIELGAIAATATALGLEIASEKLEKTVVEEISGADTHIIEYGSFKDIKTYSSAVTANTVFFPRLQLAATIQQMRALFLGLIIVIKKTKTDGKCTPEDLKKAFVDYYDATKADPTLVDRFSAILQSLDQDGDVEKFKKDIAVFFKSLPEKIVNAMDMVMLGFSTSLVLKRGVEAIAQYRAAYALPRDAQVSMLDEEGQPVADDVPAPPAAESRWLARAGIAIKAVAVLAAAASVVFAGLEIATAVDTDKKLTQAISDAKTAITNYYSGIVSQAVDATTEKLLKLGDGTELKLKVFYEVGTIAAHPEVTLTVPPEYKIVSGGARVKWSGGGNLLTASFPKDSNTWVAKAKDHRQSSPASIEAWVLAIYDPNSEWLVDIATQTSSPAQHPSASAVVQSGYVLTGGGAEAHWQSGGSLLTASYPDPAKAGSWTVASKDHIDAETTTITAYAIGLRAKGTTVLSTKVVTNTSASDAQPSTEVSPETGYSLIGGGAKVNYTGEGNLLTASYPYFAQDKWIVASKDHEKSDPSTITAYAIELKTT